MARNIYFPRTLYQCSSFYSKVTKKRQVSVYLHNKTTISFRSNSHKKNVSVLHFLFFKVLCVCISGSFHMHKADRWQPLKVNFKEQGNQKETWHLEYDMYFFHWQTDEIWLCCECWKKRCFYGSPMVDFVFYNSRKYVK